MNEIDLLNDDRYELPRNWNDGELYFDMYLKTLFNDYINDIINMQTKTQIGLNVKKYLYQIRLIADGIIESIDLYLSGQPSKAYSRIDRILVNNSNLLNQLLSRDVMGESIGILYRLRKSSEPITSREGLFHIPFHKRHRISTYRYSIPGFPCLYLGGSLYVCWEEMNRHDSSELSISAFKINESVRVLNFGYRPAEIAALIETLEEPIPTAIESFCEAYMILWPLIAACSIRVLKRDAPFKVEYIIPQMLLQWISNERSQIDGIRYFSTKITFYPNNPKINCNFAFPVKSVTHRGYCARMKSTFQLTEPKTWIESRLAIQQNLTNSVNPQSHIIIDSMSQYNLSEFPVIEAYLNKQPFAYM